MSEDVFGSDQNQQESTEPKTTGMDDLLLSIVDDSGSPKYKTVEDALKGLAHAQKHIKTIQEENQSFRLELDRRKAAEEVLEEIKRSTKQEERPSTPFDADALADQVAQRLEAKSKAEQAKRNVELVNEKIAQKFGEKAKQVVSQKAAELGLSSEMLKQVAAESPMAALKMFGFEEPKGTTVTRPTNDVNTENFNPTAGQPRWAYWQNLRRTDPRQYEKLTPQRHKELEEMGREQFFGRN